MLLNSRALLFATVGGRTRALGVVSQRGFQTLNEKGEAVRDGLPVARGLYDPKLEKGACLFDY